MVEKRELEPKVLAVFSICPYRDIVISQSIAGLAVILVKVVIFTSRVLADLELTDLWTLP